MVDTRELDESSTEIRVPMASVGFRRHGPRGPATSLPAFLLSGFRVQGRSRDGSPSVNASGARPLSLVFWRQSSRSGDSLRPVFFVVARNRRTVNRSAWFHDSVVSNPPDGVKNLHGESAYDAAAWLDNIRAVTRALLPLGYPTLERVSAALGTSTRTLQRRLHEADRTYSQLVDECRLAVARPLLAESSMRLAEISSRLGFADPGSFTRFFFRVVSETPRDYRRCHHRKP